jgi:hypothetical protein
MGVRYCLDPEPTVLTTVEYFLSTFRAWWGLLFDPERIIIFVETAWGVADETSMLARDRAGARRACRLL